MEEIKIIFDELHKYFDMVSDYLQNNDTKKYNLLVNLFNVEEPVKPTNEEEKYKYIHDLVNCIDKMRQIHEALDFEISTDITKTKAYELNKIFEITKQQYLEFLDKIDIVEIAKSLRAKPSQEYFYKYPNSIELYLISANAQKIQDDISHILEQPEFISPYLSFNSVVLGKTKKADVIIHRIQPTNVLHDLPKNLNTSQGLTKPDVGSNLTTIKNDIFRFEIERLGQGKTVAENLGTYMRRIECSPIEPKYGRPEAYHKFLDQALANAIDKRIANLSLEEANLPDVNFGIMAITEEITKILVKKIDFDNPEIDAQYKRMLIDQLDITITDALLYWVEFSCANFRKQLMSNIKRKSWSDNTALATQQIRAVVSESVASQLRKDDNIFQELYNKQHKLETTKHS